MPMRSQAALAVLVAGCASYADASATCTCPAGFVTEGTETTSDGDAAAEWCFRFCKCNSGCSCTHTQDGVEKENVAFVGIFSGYADEGSGEQITYLETKYGAMNSARSTAKTAVAEGLTGSNCNPSRKKEKEEAKSARNLLQYTYMPSTSYAVNNAALANIATLNVGTTYASFNYILGTTNCGFEIGDGWEVYEDWHSDFEDEVKATFSSASFSYDESCSTSTNHAHTVTITNSGNSFRYQIGIFKSVPGSRKKLVKKLENRRLLGGGTSSVVQAIVNADDPVVRGEVEVSAIGTDNSRKKTNRQLLDTVMARRRRRRTPVVDSGYVATLFDSPWLFSLNFFFSMDDTVRSALSKVRFELGRSILQSVTRRRRRL